MSVELNEKRRLASLPVAKWVEEQVGILPRRMAADVRRAYGHRAKGDSDALRAANLWLLRLVKGVPAGVDLTASDADLIEKAGKLSGFVQQQQYRGRDLAWLNAFAVANGASMPAGDDDAAKWARMSDAGWWRRQLRRSLAVACETLAIDIGHVHKRAGLYCSHDAMRRRVAQKRRNKALLQSMMAVNELGQQYSLDELAALSTSNPDIRKAELMARIVGFELIAKGLGHAAEFYTLTCPSKFHAYIKLGNKAVKPNPKYDTENKPREAQQYLCGVFACIRSELHRKGLQVYGFRVVEPHHDGTPHWHLLLFMEQRHVEAVREVMRKHALKMDGNEAGAQKHRFTAEAIDWSKGSAVGYIAKYISKNVDGLKTTGDSVGDDYEAMPGTDLSDTAQRVEAWAATWRVRQFQPIGGAPVTIWRELRRWQAGEVDEAEKLGAALWRELRGLPPVTSVLDEAVAAADAGHWNTFIRLMGGPLVKRADLPLTLWKVAHAEARNRYGEVRPDVTKGVMEFETGAVAISRVHEWVLQRSGEAASPRSPVNNCTESAETAEFKPEFKPEWLEWLDSINSGQPLNMPEEVAEALEENFFPDWCGEDELPSWLGAHDQPAHLKADAVPRYRQAVQRKTETRRAIDDAGGVTQYIQQVQDAANMARRISWALVKGRQHVAGWHQQGIAGIKPHAGTRKTQGGSAAAGIVDHDQRATAGKGLRQAGGDPDRLHRQAPAGSVGHGGGANQGHPPAAGQGAGAGNPIERARAWLKATC